MMPVIAWNALHASTILRDVDVVAACAVRRRHRRRRGARARAARSQHRDRDGAQPVHRLRRDGGDREGVGEDRAADSRARARARTAGREAAGRDPFGGGDDARPGIVGQAGRTWDSVDERAPRLRSRLLRSPCRRHALRAPALPLAPAHRLSRRSERPPSVSAQDLGLLETPDRDAVAEARPDHGRAEDRRRLVGRRSRRRRRLVHDSTGAPRRTERSSSTPKTFSRRWSTLIGRRVQRENLPWRQDGARHADRSASAAEARRGADRRSRYHEMDEPARPEDIVTLFANVARSLEAARAASASSISCPGAAARAGAGERVAPEEVIATARAAGLNLLARETMPPFVSTCWSSARTPRAAAVPSPTR